MIDLHCHILPGIDDGPQDLTESLALAKAMYDDGVRVAVATPHTRNGAYENPPDRVRTAVASFQNTLNDENIPLTVLPGAEVHLTAGLYDLVVSGEVGTLNDNGRYLLVEFPFQAIPPGAGEELFRLIMNGITPIIAHAERQLDFSRNPDILRKYVRAGCLVQVTAGSVSGGFGKEIMEIAGRFLKMKLVHVIASDAHSMGGRSPALSSALEIAEILLGSAQEAHKLVAANPFAVIEGKPLKIVEPQRSGRRRFFSKWFARSGTD